jgi:hypothetical protein
VPSASVLIIFSSGDIMLDIAGEILINSLKLVIELGLIITIIMILVEFTQEYRILHRLTALASPITRLLGLPQAGNLPLLAGTFLGISYGAAIIIDAGRNGSLNPDEIYLINLFLVICHSLVEDTIIWMALGAYIIPVQLARLIMALFICWVASHLVYRQRQQFPLSTD